MEASPRDGTKADHDPGRDGNPQHHQHEDERGPPSGLVQRRVRAEREHVNGVRQRLARLVQSPEPKRAPEARHEERCRFAADPRDPEERPRDHGAAGGGQHDAQDRPIAGDAESERRLPRRDGHQAQRLLGRPGDEGQRAFGRVSDSAVAGRERQEARRDGSNAADRGREEEAPERDERDDDAEKRREVHREVFPAPPRFPVEPEPHAAPSPRRRTRPIMSRAKMLIKSDMSIRTSPSSMSALSSSGSVAFRKLLAIQLAIVCPWSNREMEIALRFPIVIVTAIVSPTARPRPRMTAPKIPARAYLRTATRVVSHRVAPRLNAASRWLSGTARRASRETAEMVGMIMIARMTPAVNLSVPMAFPWKMGKNPKTSCTTGSTDTRMTGPSTKIPHRP